MYTRRYIWEEPSERLCSLCGGNEIEDECHFIFNCNFYHNEREILFKEICINSFENEFEALEFLMSEKIRQFARYIEAAFTKRKNRLYN